MANQSDPYGNVAILLGDGAGGFSAPDYFTPPNPIEYYSAIVAADFNGDGKLDLATGNNILLGDGKGGFTAAGAFGSTATVGLAVADFNGDGKPDVAVASYSDSTEILTNVYTPPPMALTSANSATFAVATGTFGAGEFVEGGKSGSANAFNGYGRLLVNGAPFQASALSPTTANDGQSVLTGDGGFSGLTVSREITVPNTGNEDFARTVDSFANPTAAAITVTVQIVGNLGSDADTTVFATSDGDDTVDASDQWIGTDGNGTPAIIHYIHGPGGLLPSSAAALVGDNIQWTYNLTVPAGQTVELAYFTIVAPSRTEATAAANALVTRASFGGQAAAFLSSADLASLGNFQFPQMAATVNLNTTAPQSNDTLTATATKWDAVGKTVTLTYVWRVNGTVKRTFASATALTDTFDLSIVGNGDAGDTVTVSVTPNDGTQDGPTVTATATVSNAAPTAMLDTIGLFAPTSSVFYLRNTNDTGYSNMTFGYGPSNAGWKPIAGDWNADGTGSIGLYNPATSQFYLRNTNDNGYSDLAFAYGPASAGWLPIAGDWDGDGRATIGLYDPKTSVFYLRNTNSTGYSDLTFAFGPAGAGWLPIAGDWNGDGKDTVGLYNPTTSQFYLRNTNDTGFADVAFSYGPANAGWLPVAGDWAHDDEDTIGLYNPATSQFYLRDTNDTGYSNQTFTYGPAGAGWFPIMSGWSGSTDSSLPSAGSTTSTGTTIATGTMEYNNVRIDAGMLQMGAPNQAIVQGTVIKGLSGVASVLCPTVGQVTQDTIRPDSSAGGTRQLDDPTPVQGCITWNGTDQLLRVEPSAVDQIDLSTVAQNELGPIAGSNSLDALADDAMGVAGFRQVNSTDAVLSVPMS